MYFLGADTAQNFLVAVFKIGAIIGRVWGAAPTAAPAQRAAGEQFSKDSLGFPAYSKH